MGKPYQFNWDRLRPYASHQLVFKPLLHVLLRVVFKIRVHGRENVPKKAGGMILACNHLHAADPGFLVIATRGRWRFIAKKELYQSRASGWICVRNNAFPVDRDIIDRRALRFAVSVLEDGRCGLGIFPEGARSPDGTPQSAKNGIAMLARETRADILPCSLYYEGKLKPGKKVTVRVGQRIPFEALGLGDIPNKRESREATEKIMAAITALWEQKHG